jgi:hypothetical protein
MEKQLPVYRKLSDLNESGAGILLHNRPLSDPEMDNYEIDWQALYSDLVNLMNYAEIGSEYLANYF